MNLHGSEEKRLQFNVALDEVSMHTDTRGFADISIPVTGSGLIFVLARSSDFSVKH